MKLDVPYKLISDSPIDVDEIVNCLEDKDFYLDTRRSSMNAMEHTNTIILRHTESYMRFINTGSGEVKAENFLDLALMPKYKSCIDKILLELKKYYNFSDYLSLIARLKPKTSVGIHVDGTDLLSTCHRIHIPLITNKDCLYKIDDTIWHMEKGMIYEIDNMRKHGTENNGSDFRVHLIINLYP
jgi:hypothetical protein